VVSVANLHNVFISILLKSGGDVGGMMTQAAEEQVRSSTA